MSETKYRKQGSEEALKARGEQWFHQALLQEDRQQVEAVLWDRKASGGEGQI